ncbi:MAG: CopD family protein [Gammaproteobacteria bacterium]
MLWLLLLHISAVVCWSGSLLYLTALIAGACSRQTALEQTQRMAVMFMVYRLLSSPAALFAIVTGTALYLTGGITDRWLILKLTLVVALVLCHVVTGLLILITRETPAHDKKLYRVAVQAAAATLIPAIIWTVLTKPL